MYGYTIGGVIALMGILVVVGVGGFGFAVGGQVAIPTFTPSPTFTPIPPSPTLTPTDRARIRVEPQGSTLRVLSNGTIVQVMPEVVDIEGVVWWHVLGPDGEDGWMVSTLLVLVTPEP